MKKSLPYDQVLQDELRKSISFNSSFVWEDNEIHYGVETGSGLTFFADGVNAVHRSGFLRTSKGIRLFYQYWYQGASGSNILFMHGNAENSCAHPKFIWHLLKRGCNVFTFDQEGYGDSDGLRGTFDGWDSYVDNALVCLDHFDAVASVLKAEERRKKRRKKKEPDLPWILSGFSMGGLEALAVAKRVALKIGAVIALAPWLKVHKRVMSPLALAYIQWCAPYFNKARMMREESQWTILRGGEEVYRQFYRNLSDNVNFLDRRFKDRRIHRLVTKYWLGSIRRAQMDLLTNPLPKMPPAWFFIPQSDLIVDREAEQTMAAKLGAEAIELPRCYHEFLDYEDDRWDYFAERLDYCLTKIEVAIRVKT